MPTPWPNGARAAISLSYDDGLPEHVDAVPRALEARGLRGTFYVPGNSQVLHERPEAFGAVAKAGHELGNHTLFHPCRKDFGRPGGRDWVPEAYDLAQYDGRRIREELRLANLLLHLIDGQSRRSYGSTCCEITMKNGEPLHPHISDLVSAVRGTVSNDCWLPDGSQTPLVPCVSGDNKTAEHLLGLIDAAAGKGGWLILMFHGVGETGHQLSISADEHNRLLDALGKRDDLSIAPVTTIADHLAAART